MSGSFDGFQSCVDSRFCTETRENSRLSENFPRGGGERSKTSVLIKRRSKGHAEKRRCRLFRTKRTRKTAIDPANPLVSSISFPMITRPPSSCRDETVSESAYLGPEHSDTRRRRDVLRDHVRMSLSTDLTYRHRERRTTTRIRPVFNPYRADVYILFVVRMLGIVLGRPTSKRDAAAI